VRVKGHAGRASRDASVDAKCPVWNAIHPLTFHGEGVSSR
jgi:hypothetical protein